MPLKSLTNMPPGGYTYTQPQTQLQFRQLIPLPEQARLVSAHRVANGLQNPTIAEAMVDIENWTCVRLNNDPEWCISDAQKKTASHQFASLLGRGVQAVAESVSKAVTGARILYEWFGEGGKPVEQALAQRRADCCVACPKNSTDRTWLSGLSEVAHEHLEHRSSIGMKVDREDLLGVCTVCACPMKLKIHTPIHLVAKHTTGTTMADLDNIPTACWVRDEVRQTQLH